MRTPNCTAWYSGPCEIPSPLCPASITLIPLPLTLAYNPCTTLAQRNQVVQAVERRSQSLQDSEAGHRRLSQDRRAQLRNSLFSAAKVLPPLGAMQRAVQNRAQVEDGRSLPPPRLPPVPPPVRFTLAVPPPRLPPVGRTPVE